MNCRCNPPRSAVIRRVAKAGSNFDKQFFTCEIGADGCGFFHWADATMPPPSNKAMLRKGKASSSSAITTKGKGVKIKIALHSIHFDGRPPMKICLYIQFPYLHEISNFMESLPKDQCHFSSSTKLWVFSLQLYERVTAFLETEEVQKLQFQIDTPPRFLVVGLKNYLKRINILPDTSNMDLNITASLQQMLMPFQVDGIKFVVARGGRALIGDEMGCGKTIQAIAILQHYRNNWPALLIVPPNLMDQWKSEILKFCGDFLTEKDLCFVKKSSDKVVGRIVIIPYSIIEKVVEQGKIRPEAYGVVIADESHNLKSPDAQRTKAVLPFLKRAQVAICLTGTPAVNRPVELFTQLSALLPNVFTDYKEFIIRYCDAKPARYNPSVLEAKGASNEAELKLLLENMVMIRRLKADVVQLPTKLREVRYVEAEGKYLAELLRLQKQSAALENDFKDPRKSDDERQIIKNAKEKALLLLYQLTGLSKIKAIKVELLRQIDEARVERAKEWSKQMTEKLLAEDADDNLIDIAALETLDEIDYHPSSSLECVDLCDENILKRVDENDLVDTDEEEEDGKGRKRNIESSFEPLRKKLRKSKTDHLKSSNQRTLDELFSHDLKTIDENDSDGGDIENNEEDDEDVEFGEEQVFYKTKTKRKKTSKRSSSDANDAVDEGTSSMGHTRLSKKILVFAHHRRVLDAIEVVLREAQVEYVRVDGKTSAAKKSKLIQEFQESPLIDVALLAITACGTGLNMTVANVAIFAELYWSPGVVLQAEDRIHRIGQTSDEVKIIYILARNTADDIVWEQIHRKQTMLEATIGNGGHESSIAANVSLNKKKKQELELAQTRLDSFIQPTNLSAVPQSHIQQEQQLQTIVIDEAPAACMDNNSFYDVISQNNSSYNANGNQIMSLASTVNPPSFQQYLYQPNTVSVHQSFGTPHVNSNFQNNNAFAECNTSEHTLEAADVLTDAALLALELPTEYDDNCIFSRGSNHVNKSNATNYLGEFASTNDEKSVVTNNLLHQTPDMHTVTMSSTTSTSTSAVDNIEKPAAVGFSVLDNSSAIDPPSLPLQPVVSEPSTLSSKPSLYVSTKPSSVVPPVQVPHADSVIDFDDDDAKPKKKKKTVIINADIIDFPTVPPISPTIQTIASEVNRTADASLGESSSNVMNNFVASDAPNPGQEMNALNSTAASVINLTENQLNFGNIILPVDEIPHANSTMELSNAYDSRNFASHQYASNAVSSEASVFQPPATHMASVPPTVNLPVVANPIGSTATISHANHPKLPSGSLTAEQLAKIEINRQNALKKRQLALERANAAQTHGSISSVSSSATHNNGVYPYNSNSTHSQFPHQKIPLSSSSSSSYVKPQNSQIPYPQNKNMSSMSHSTANSSQCQPYLNQPYPPSTYRYNPNVHHQPKNSLNYNNANFQPPEPPQIHQVNPISSSHSNSYSKYPASNNCNSYEDNSQPYNGRPLPNSSFVGSSIVPPNSYNQQQSQYHYQQPTRPPPSIAPTSTVQQLSHVHAKFTPFVDPHFNDDMMMLSQADPLPPPPPPSSSFPSNTPQFQTANQNTIIVTNPHALRKADQIFHN